MTREEAIEILKDDAYVLYEDDSPYNRQAYDMAIEALQAQKTGKWIKTYRNGFGNMIGYCNECGRKAEVDNYCPSCGTRMVGERDG